MPRRPQSPNGQIFVTEPLLRRPFLERPNRFILRYEAGKRRGRAYLANPGRLGEILLPGTDVLLARRRHTKIGWEAVGAAWSRRWPGDTPRVVFLNTGRVNHVARRLLEEQRIPELAAYRVVQPEFTLGRSRFDFLLEGPQGPYLLEVKSVTLTERNLALFPDARSERACRHLEELARSRRGGRFRAGVLFLVQGEARRFSPDFHNDLAFSRTFLRQREHLEYLPYQLEPHLDSEGRIVFAGAPRRLCIDWEHLQTGNRDGGLYLLVLHLPRRRRLTVGSLGTVTLEKGAYVYVGSAQRGLTRRIERHLRHRKRLHWHIDALRALCDRVEAFPIRGVTGECDLAHAMARMGSRPLSGFGASDCGCAGHLIRLPDAASRSGPFQETLTRLRHAGFP
jgi:sugar fermentation stimulation protein A